MTQPLLDAEGIGRLRSALRGADYTAEAIADHIGRDAIEAVRRNDFRGALAATADTGDRLNTLIRLFIANQTVTIKAAEAALDPLPLDTAIAAGFLEPFEAGMRAGLELKPYADDWWVLSDLGGGLRPGPLRPDHVLGVGGASTTLAHATIRRPVDTALDLGTGCGVQALHLSTHASRVTGTDLSSRALRFAATTAALNGLDWELRHGDLLDPVAGRRFDLVVSNPPFVIGSGVATHTYRDSGRPGDAVCAELAAAAPRMLTEGGTLQFLANWLQIRGQDWQDRVAGWLAGTGCDAWVIQREVTDPVAYVNLWLADAGESADPWRMAGWLDWFDAQKAVGVGFGLVTMRRSGHADPVIRMEDVRHEVDNPLGPVIADWFDRQDWVRTNDLLAARFIAAPGLQLHQEATMGPDGWAVDRQLLVRPDGMRWREEVDPLILALVSGCDGQVSLRDQITVLAAAHDADEDALAEVAGPLVAHLVERGLIRPVP